MNTSLTFSFLFIFDFWSRLVFINVFESYFNGIVLYWMSVDVFVIILVSSTNSVDNDDDDDDDDDDSRIWRFLGIA